MFANLNEDMLSPKDMSAQKDDPRGMDKRLGKKEGKAARSSGGGSVNVAYLQKLQIDGCGVQQEESKIYLLHFTLDEKGTAQQSLKEVWKKWKVVETEKLRLQIECNNHAHEARETKRLLKDHEDTMQQVLEEIDIMQYTLEDKENQLEQAKSNTCYLLRERADALSQAAEQDRQIKECRTKLQQAQTENESLQRAFDVTQRQLKVAKDETNRLQKEREEENLRRKSAQRWTPKNFEKQKELGKGAFGVVYRCFDKDLFKFFVAKETRSQTAKMIKTAKNEIRRLKRMCHANIIVYYGCKRVGDTITIFMEYMTAGSVKDLIDKYGSVKEQTCIRYIEQILDALAYIHQLGIVHSDIKCANLLHDGQDNIKLGDFGIAVQKRLNSLDCSYFIDNMRGGGTLFWMAPEVIMENNRCSRRSDMWSFGCTIIEMLTKKAPYADLPQRRFMGALYILTKGGSSELTYDPRELVPGSSDKMKTFISYLLVVDVNKRLHSGTHAIEKFKEIFCIAREVIT